MYMYMYNNMYMCMYMYHTASVELYL
jgi:hypothetical protein